MVNFNINVVINPARAKSGARQVEKSLDRLNGKANNLGASLRRALGFLGAGLLARKAIGTLANFSQEMSTVAAITNATEKEFAALEERAISLGTNTRFTATQAAEGLTELGRAGLTVEEAMTAVGDSLLLAQAGGLGIAESAAIATTAVKVFRLEAEDVAEVADTLVIAANNTKTNVSEMGQAFTFVAANAKDLGVDVNDTAAALGVLAEGGLTATRGGTALRSVLLGLAAPSREAEVALRDAGLSMSDIDIEARGLKPVLETLAAAQLDSAAKAAIFGKRFSAASSILFSNLDKFDELNGKFDTLGGEAQRVADVMDDNLNGSILGLKSAFEGLILRVGQQGGEGAIRGFVDTLRDGLRSAAENIERFIMVVQGLATVLTVNLARKAIPAVINQIRLLGIAIATNPLGAIATAITLAIGFLVAFRDEITLTQGKVTTFADFATAAWDSIKVGLEALGIAFTQLSSDIATSLGGTFDGFQLNLQEVLLGVATFGDTAIGLFTGIASSLIALFSGLPKAVGSAILIVLGGINNFIEAITDRVRAMVNTVVTVLSSLGQQVVLFVSELNLALSQLAQGSVGAAAKQAEEAADQLAQSLGGVGKNFSRTFAGELKALEGDRLLEPVENIFEGAGEEMAENMSKGFENGLSFSGLTDFTLETFKAADAIGAARVAAEGQAVAQAAANDETERAIALAGAVPPAMEPATASVASFGDQLSGGFKSGLEAGIAGITDVSGAAETLMVNSFGAAEDALVSFATTGEADFSAFVDGFLEDLARLLARQALFGLISSLGGGGLVGAAGSAAGGGGIPGFAKGGDFDGSTPFIAGEEGPELITPKGAGTVSNASKTAGLMNQAAPAPAPVNVTVLNSSSPEDTISAMGSAQGTQLIMNAISSNPTVIKNALQ
mgnify:CR=1 FL=1|tara:strand:+ start:2667 stop:5372 length:2706 start_codon:yes stop_codon:yes gene_type:complete